MTSGTPGGTPAAGPAQSAGCPDDERLASLLGADVRPRSASASASGTGAGTGADELALHLEGCEACRRRLDAMAGGSEWLAAVRADDANVAAGDEVAGERGAGDRGDSTKGRVPPLLQAVMDELRQATRGMPQVIDEGEARAPGAAGESDLADEADEDGVDFLEPCALPGYRGKFGPYLIIDVVGRGGMGVVLKAHDPALDRVVAIKVLSPALAASATARRRFVREARAAAAVSHEHVVTIHAVDEAAGAGAGPGRVRLPYLVMQFVSGRSLEARLRETGPLKLEEILRIGMQAAAGLAAAHAQGLVHRDVKPANIMLENGVERVKLTDFGLARAADDAAITLTGQVTGTPHYMAPEQARGGRVDHRADLFALGGVLYALCTGRPPFGGADPISTLRQVCDEEPPPIGRMNEDVPGWLVGIVEGLMRKDPAARPQSAAAVAEQLGRRLARIQFSGMKGWEGEAEGGGAGAGDSAGAGAAEWVGAAEWAGSDRAGMGADGGAGPVAGAGAAGPGVSRAETGAAGPGTGAGTGAGGGVSTRTGHTESDLFPSCFRNGSPWAVAAVAVAAVVAAAVMTRPKGTTGGAAPAAEDRAAGAAAQLVGARAAASGPSSTAPASDVATTTATAAATTANAATTTATAAATTATAAVARFTVIAPAGGEGRAFESFEAAVNAAGGGATIEIAHDGVLATPPVDLGRKALRIRAAAGSRPVLAQGPDFRPILTSAAALVLEGLEFQGSVVGRPETLPAPEEAGPALVAVSGGPLYVANCRFAVRGIPRLRATCLRVEDCGTCEIRTSELHSMRGIGVQWRPTPGSGATLRLEHVVAASRMVVVVRKEADRPATVIVDRSTLYAGALVTAHPTCAPKGMSVELADSALVMGAILFDPLNEREIGRFQDVPVLAAETFLERLVPNDSGARRVASGSDYVAYHPSTSAPSGRSETRPTQQIHVDARVYFTGEVRAKAARNEPPTVADFALHSVRMPGQGLLPPRRLSEIGADVDRVGPRGPYDVFRRSDQYEQWSRRADAALRH